MIPLHFRPTAADATPETSTQKTDFSSSLLFQSNPALPKRQVVKSRMAAGSARRGHEEVLDEQLMGAADKGAPNLPINEVASTIFREKSRFENGSAGEDSANPAVQSDSP